MASTPRNRSKADRHDHVSNDGQRLSLPGQRREADGRRSEARAGHPHPLVAGFERLYHDRDDVNVGGDFFWYPVEGEVHTVVAPDVTVIVGTQKVLLRSYRQWEHGGQPVLVVEVVSFSNTASELDRKRRFYERYGVLEYWLVDPHKGTFEVWLREGERLVAVPDPAAGFVSPTSHVVTRLSRAEPDPVAWSEHLDSRTA